ncbi:MAG: branched-chain amino acid ABC transporter permease [Akkermansiaceae bacterium]|nr:branched-chain amino acid ABC transporter permease [Akkermansiaceae bacterium]
MNFFLSYLILAQIFAIMALSTNFLVGIIGIFSVSQAALMGVGAYAYAGVAMAGMPFPVALLAAVTLCALLNTVTSLPALRLAGDYFVITSFGLQFIATAVFVNWVQVTGGSTGIAAIPAPRMLGISFEEPQYFVILSSLALALASLAYTLLMRSSYGRVLHAVRLNELAAGAAGRNVLKMKLGVSAVSGIYAGLAGALYAIFMSYIDPSSFEIQQSIVILTMLVIGGARTLAGSLIGPLLLLAIPQVLSLVHIAPELLGPTRALVFGALLVVFMLWRPQGIAGRKI